LNFFLLTFSHIFKVHTANGWESVDLGDQNRKNKFLKLMGAFKNPDKNAPPIKQRKPGNYI